MWNAFTSRAVRGYLQHSFLLKVEMVTDSSAIKLGENGQLDTLEMFNAVLYCNMHRNTAIPYTCEHFHHRRNVLCRLSCTTNSYLPVTGIFWRLQHRVDAITSISVIQISCQHHVKCPTRNNSQTETLRKISEMSEVAKESSNWHDQTMPKSHHHRLIFLHRACSIVIMYNLTESEQK